MENTNELMESFMFGLDVDYHVPSMNDSYEESRYLFDGGDDIRFNCRTGTRAYARAVIRRVTAFMKTNEVALKAATLTMKKNGQLIPTDKDARRAVREYLAYQRRGVY